MIMYLVDYSVDTNDLACTGLFDSFNVDHLLPNVSIFSIISLEMIVPNLTDRTFVKKFFFKIYT